ncbi:hypothetical protein POSPLADRAFT_1050868 [Postia placenta MAD-698-R-SB12]|uniref:Uncharacterized protein n=1 Tax=Postia placenta MAD-698-R-SB12 TaxID=670580 RepID=A0A1X6MIF7_9APHY|nr:hypothetical protein POSPLADRAFT_1050868 [Postia placenta MAD-698-R-SB12]OSX56211.1 hypothetical protein POSPLADRAFT_1050868 [Postia placenta MAD-698-R-SB12]
MARDDRQRLDSKRQAGDVQLKLISLRNPRDILGRFSSVEFEAREGHRLASKQPQVGKGANPSAKEHDCGEIHSTQTEQDDRSERRQVQGNLWAWTAGTPFEIVDSAMRSKQRRIYRTPEIRPLPGTSDLMEFEIAGWQLACPQAPSEDIETRLSEWGEIGGMASSDASRT